MEPNERTFKPAEVGKLDDPQRRVWLPPAEVVSLLELRPGMCVADIGAGNGYFTLPLAEAVAPAGVVQAVDFQPEMLSFLRQKLAATNTTAKVEVIQGTALDTTLAESTCDLVLLANVWHELDNHDAVLAEVRRILRGGRRIAILDWRTDVSRPPGPPVEHRIASQSVSAALAADGWLGVTEQTVGTYSYLVTAVRPA